MRLPTDQLEARARHIRLLLLDVDGVLTDGSILVGPDGLELKSFFVRDGAAIVMAQRAGIEVGFLSGRASAPTAVRAAELGVQIVVQGELDKATAFDKILAGRALEPAAVAYMGDDLLDLPVLRRVGLAAAPADAVLAVLDEVHWTSSVNGGRGAVRELVDMLLTMRTAGAPADGDR